MPKKNKKTRFSINTTLPEPIFAINGGGTIQLRESIHKHCEWCFQFDDESPVIFASTNENYSGKNASVSFTVLNKSTSNIVFRDSVSGKTFKIFAREKV